MDPSSSAADAKRPHPADEAGGSGTGGGDQRQEDDAKRPEAAGEAGGSGSAPAAGGPRRGGRRRWRRTAVAVAAAALGLLAVVAGRVVLSSRAEYRAGRRAEQQALDRSDPERRSRGLRRAVSHYRRAARWYAPGNGYVNRALDRLAAIGHLAEQQGDAETALRAYRSIRRAVLGARSFYTPHRRRLEAANDRIAALSARVGGQRRGADELERLAAWHRRQLARSRAPGVGWVVLALLGFALWIAGAVLFIFRAIGPADRLRRRPALWWGAVVLMGLLLWLVGLTQA